MAAVSLSLILAFFPVAFNIPTDEFIRFQIIFRDSRISPMVQETPVEDDCIYQST